MNFSLGHKQYPITKNNERQVEQMWENYLAQMKLASWFAPLMSPDYAQGDGESIPFDEQDPVDRFRKWLGDNTRGLNDKGIDLQSARVQFHDARVNNHDPTGWKSRPFNVEPSGDPDMDMPFYMSPGDDEAPLPQLLKPGEHGVSPFVKFLSFISQATQNKPTYHEPPLQDHETNALHKYAHQLTDDNPLFRFFTGANDPPSGVDPLGLGRSPAQRQRDKQEADKAADDAMRRSEENQWRNTGVEMTKYYTKVGKRK